MPLRKVELGNDIHGKLYLHSMPGRVEPIDSFFDQAAQHEVDLVACLVDDEEIARVSPEYAHHLRTNSFPFKRITFAIEDYGIPSDVPEFLEFMAHLAHSIQAGQNVLIHCAAGVGRTGLAAAGVLMQLGYPRQDAIAAVYEAGSRPEIGEQGDFLRRLDGR